MQNGKAYYFVQTADFTIAHGLTTYFSGVFDGDGHSITAADAANGTIALFGDAATWYGLVGDVTVQNLTTYSTANCGLSIFQNQAASGNKLVVKNISARSVNNALVQVNSNNFGFITLGSNYKGTLTGTESIFIENCDVYASVQNVGTCAAALIGQSHFTTGIPITIKDCDISGNIYGSSYAGVIYGNPSYNKLYDTSENQSDSNVTEKMVEGKVTIDNVHFTGTVRATYANAFSANTLGKAWILNSLYQDEIGGTYISAPDVLTSATLSVKSLNDAYYLDATGAVGTLTYKLIFSVSAVKWTGTEYVSNGLKVIKDISTDTALDGANALILGKAYTRTAANTANVTTAMTELAYNDGTYIGADIEVYFNSEDSRTYVIYEDNSDFTVNCAVTAWIYAYNSDGVIVGSKKLG